MKNSRTFTNKSKEGEEKEKRWMVLLLIQMFHPMPSFLAGKATVNTFQNIYLNDIFMIVNLSIDDQKTLLQLTFSFTASLHLVAIQRTMTTSFLLPTSWHRDVNDGWHGEISSSGPFPPTANRYTST